VRRSVLAAVMAATTLIGSAVGASAAPPDRASYLVVLDAGTRDVPAAAAALARTAGGDVGFVYEHALKGFSIRASAAGAAALSRSPGVAYVEVDREVSLAVQDVPTGIDRIFATGNTSLDIDGSDDVRVDVDVAVIDTGVDLEHPDLNVVGGVSCASGGPFGGSCSAGGDDDHYHGTHVAGTIGALDNAEGVVGVAPGARIWAVKVLNQRGSGYTSWIVAGIDWVAANADTIEVANMSLGGSGYSQAEYDAIQGAVDAGVAFAVAAGNDSDDASNHSPAAFDNVLTVSALADFDGEPGALAPATCRSDQDDTLADFSNFGSAVDIAAPGVCIRSTFPLEEGGYGTISGTSMASPHVAGALAILASGSGGGASDAAGVADLYTAVISAGNLGWTDESGDGEKEPLLDVSGFSATTAATGDGGGGEEPPPPPSGEGSLSGTSTSQGKTWTATVTFAGSAGESVSGTWDLDGSTGGCTIATGASSCSFSLSGIAKKTASVTYTANTGESITILKS
jgi:subtilisin